MRKKILLMTFLTLLLTAMGTGALYAQDNVVTIGSITNVLSGDVPLCNNYEYSISQQYYLSGEIGESKNGDKITHVAFYADEEDVFHHARSLTIFMVNTEDSYFVHENNNDYTKKLDASNKVFTGNVIFKGGDWNRIELNTPFQYTGKNILLCVVDNTNEWEGYSGGNTYGHDKFECFNYKGDGTYRSISTKNSDNKYDPTASEIEGRLSEQVPCVQFTFEVPIQFEGEGTEESPYIIADIDDLNNLRNKVNEGETYVGKYFKLTSDITLTDEWTPIGTGSRSSKSYSGNAFKGTFDGGDHTISGLKITSTTADDAAIGLFGIVDGGTVMNLKLTDVNINVTNSDLAGAAIGMMLNGATADKITVSGAIVGNDGVGGIVGRLIIDGTISNCINNASVTSSYGGIGGIVGKPYYEDGANTSTFASITNCTNNGTVTAPMYIGGIAGLARANVTDCINNGEVKGGTQTGGIVGQLIAAGTVSGNENKAKVSGKNHLGGIIGDYSQSSAYTYYNVSIANNINRGELAATEQCAAIMGCNNIDGFEAMTATGNVSYYYVEGLELFGNPEDMAIDATNKFILPEAKINDVEYSTFAEAAAAAQAGSEIKLLANIEGDITVPANVTLNGNGFAISGGIFAEGDITFAGVTKAASFNVENTNTVVNIPAGASLQLTGTGRMVIGHGCTFNITGSIADNAAKTADKATLVPSLVMPGASFTGAGVTFNVTNAYISAPSSYCSSSSSASGTFDFNIENSIWESAGKLAFESQSTAATVNFDLVESVLNTGSHLVFGVSRGEVVIDNSNVNVGTSRQIENQSTMTIKNGSVVNGAVATSSNAKNPGTIIVEDATYAVTGEFSGSDLGTGTLIIKKGATVSAGSITKADIQIDATGMAIGNEINLTANLANLAGTLEVINNDNLDAEIIDGKIVLVEKPVAQIGTVKYGTLNEALNAAAQTEELTTIQLLAGTHTFGNVKFPATLKNVTIVGADNKATIIKDSKLYSADGNAVTYKGITFDGIIFDNSSILFTGARNGEVVYEDWTIKNCDFRNLQSIDGIAAIHFNLAADETIKNFTFENNTITNVTSPINTASGLRLNYVTGDVVIKDNETNNVAFNAVQIINSEVDNFTFEGNILRSNGSSLANLYNVTGENIVITKNQFLANEDQNSVSNIAYADVSGNYWGGGAPTNLPEGFVCSSYYTTVESDGTLGGLVELPQGNDFTGYTRGDAIWGEVWGNAKESFVIKVLDANGNVMGTTSLNNVGGIINGNVNVTWSLKLDAASNTDEYWTMEWTTAPTIDNMPAKVELWVDGDRVSGGNVVLNGPDNINKIYAAVTDNTGKILAYHTNVQEAIKAAAAVTSVAKTATAGTVEVLSDVTVDKWVMFAEKMSIGDGSLITLNINGVTIDGNNNTLTVKSIESASNGGYLFYDAQNLTVKDLTINIADGLVGGIGLQSGTISNVTFNGGQYAVLPGKNGVTIDGCTFNDTKGYAIYYEDARPGIVVDGNTFNTAEGKYAITMRSDEQFTNNTITKGRVNIASSSSATVTSNDFNDVRFKVYNEATATISDNEINNLVFNETTSPAASTFTNNTLSPEAQAAINALPALAGEGTEANPYTISNLAQLKAFRDDVNDGNNYAGKYVKLTGDIDLNNEEWTPIGNNTNKFQGYFDGNEKTISNLKISGNNKYVGLFGYILGQGMSASTTPSVKDLTLDGVNVSGDYYVGGLSGQAYTCNITNVTVKGEVSGVRYVGGLVGHVYTYFKDCHFIGNASCSFDALGGIAGAGDCRAYDCSVIGDITGSNWVGGIVGNGQEGTSAVGCYVEGDVKTSNNYYRGVGGIAGVAGHGYASSEFKNNYFNGEVYLGDVKIPAMIMGLVNANDNASIKATVEGNSWNTDYYDVNTPVYVVAEISSSDASLEDWIAGTSKELTKPRNNNLVMLESDLQYVTEEDYVIMSFSEVKEEQVEQALINNAVAKIDETTYTTLQKALDAAVAGTGNVTVEILRNIDLTGIDWNPVTVSGPGYPVVTVNGNNDTITGLNDMLFAGTWAGNSGLIINDLTIANSNIVNDENDANGNIGVGAFIGFPQASETITLNNCHLVNSTVKGGHWTGGLIGYAAGYAGTDGPVFMELTITGCSVTGSTITGKGSAGGIIGHGSGNAWTNVVIEETTVSNNTITSTGTSTNKAGAIMGTIGAAGQPTTVNGVTHTGGATVSATVADNTVTSGGTTITTIYGRQGTPTGMLELAGGSYDNYPIEENVAYAAPVEGYEIVENTNGTYGVEKSAVAKIGDVEYKYLQAAFDAAQNDATIMMIADVTVAEEVIIDNTEKAVTLDMNGKTWNGAIKPSKAKLTIKNGTINNENASISAIEITYGELNLNGVNIASARHAVRIDGDVEATINGGTYKAAQGSGKGTYHAANISGNANVTITDGKFVGPKGTSADSGSALKVQSSATVTIEGGDFSGGKNHTLSADGNLIVKGGTFDQDPSAYKADDYTVQINKDGKYEVLFAVAVVETTYYADLHEAMVAAKSGETVKLVNDVDLAGTEWEPVSFKGIFDGQYHTISNLTINKPGVSNTGFITSLNGTFKNVTFTNPTVTGGENTAVVAGRAGGAAALAENITINGTIKVETTHSGYARAAAIVGGWAYGNYKNITVDGGDKDASYIKHTGGGDGRYVAGIVGHADDVKSYVNCTVKNITISGGWLCGAIAGPGPAVGLASGCSVENIDMGANYSGGMFGWYYGDGTIKDATVKNVTFTKGSANNGIIGGYGQNTDANVENLIFENVQNNNGAPLLDHVASIGNNHYFTFEAALDAVQNGETITLLNRTGSEISKEIEFTKDSPFTFTITGTAPNYALPIITFQNATVNIENANFQIPELDARQNATINVINSTIVDAGGNSIVKSYYNGAINIDANSTVYAMQVTTMGYITVAGTLNATWQTNVYGNGLITLNEGATFNTAALHLTAQDYSGRDNTDAERAGKPAEIVVDGANFTVGKVLSAGGADYSYNSSKGINVGTVDGKSAILNIKNGGNVNIWMANGETTNFGAGATVNVNASTFNVACRAESGTVTLANNGTVYVTGASNLAAANVTGAGWFYMNGVKLDADTELIGAKVGFINGTNNIVGSTIENGFFSVGIGQNTAAEATATFAETNNIELGSVTVNVSEDAVIGGNGETYSGWVGSAYSADKTQHTYALNVENSLATFGYMHVSKDGAMTIKGHSDNKYTYDNANVDFYAGELIINGAVTLNGTDAWSKFTKMSVDHVDGVLNIANGTNFESSIHNGSNTSASLKFWKAGKVNIDATSKVEIDNETVLVEGAELNIASKNVIAKGAVTGAGAINLTDLDAKFTAQEGLTVNNGVVGNTDFGVAYIDGAYQLAGYIAQIGDEKYLTLQTAFDAAVNGSSTTTITMIDDVTITEEVRIDNTEKAVILDMNEKTWNGAIKPSNANLTIKNGTINNENASYSAIEINAGVLNIENVKVTSTRHGIRIDGAVTATINGGEYHGGKTEGTRHALNVSGAADVTITAGTFVGPKGTTADSGAAVNVQTGAKVSIEGGDFTGGKNNTLAADGTLTVTGGTFDQDPSIYVPTGYVTVLNSENKYQVSKGVVKIVVDETTTYYASLSAAIAAAEEGQTIVLLADITEDVTFNKALTLDGNDNSFNYTGKISLSKNIDFSVMNTNFYNGTLHLGSESSEANYNITGCNFISTSSVEWPMNLAGANEIKIEKCKSEGYKRFLYVYTANNVNVNTVTIEGTTSAAIVINKTVNNFTLDEVTMNGSNLLINFSKAFSKNNTVTIKNSNITAANGIIGNSADMTNKIVFEGATELNQDIFSGENDLRDKVTVVAEALIGTKVYGKFDDALAVVQEGETINVINPVVVTEDKEYDFTGKRIVGNEVYPVIRIQNDANVTVKGEGSITNNDYVFVLGSSDQTSAGNLTIEDGTFTGTTTVASVTKGLLTIKGGEFKVDESDYGATYMINCIDANNVNGNGTALVAISGGTFYGFNPQANAAENPKVNFCAEGFAATEIEENVWKVLPAKTMIDETKYKYVSLSAAIAAAEDGQTIILLADITEDVTFDKDLTLDGNSFNYTGKITSTNINFSVKKTNFVNGSLYLGNKYSKTNYNITDCNFTSNTSLEWPMNIPGAKEINIVNCKSEGYKRFLYLINAETVNVNNVTIDGTTSAAIVINKTVNNVTLDNVTMKGSALFIHFQENYSKNNTVTIKNSNITAGNGIIANAADMTNKIVFEGATELNQDVFSGDNDLRDKVTVVAEALIGTKVYGKFDDALAVVQEGETINVINPVVVTEDKEYDFTEKTIVGNEVYPVIRIQNDANVTVTGEGSITNDDYVFVLGASDDSSAGNLTIENGTFTGTTTVASVTKGTLSINGGEFKVNDSEYGATYMINCIDANYNDEEANILISGGTFYGFNPQNNAAEGANTNFCADGFGTKEIEDNVWKVFPMQTTQLSAGWNWFSAYVDIEGVHDEDGQTVYEGLTMIQNALGTNGIQIKKQGNFSTYEKDLETWFGNFAIYNKETLFINVTESQELTIVGEIVNPEDHTITLNPNWNWIGYPLNTTLLMSEAFEQAGLTPSDGDIVKHQDDFASYLYIDEEIKGWIGDFYMNPGEGFMYMNNSTSSNQLTYKYPTNSNNRSETRANVTTEVNHWTPNASQYPNNMTMMAMVDVEGGDYEVAAFVDGEVRGSARPIYVEALDNYMLFLTIHGEGVEEMTFKFYDLATGEESALNDRMNYSDNAIVGSLKEPYMFKRGTTGIGEASLSEINIYPNPTTTGKEINLQATCDKVEVFNALGVKVAEYQNVDSIDAIETAGIYVIRITNDSNVQNCRLVVK